MKKILFLSLVAILLTGCSDKDQNYYLKNIEKAQDKVNNCDRQWEEVGWDGDRIKQDEIRDDPECNAAKDAIEEYEKQQRINEIKAQYDQTAQEIKTKYGQLDWVAFTTVFNNVYQGYLENEPDKTDTGEIDWLRISNPKMQAWSDAYRSKINPAKEEMSKQTVEQLRAQESKYCSTDRRSHSACSVWNQALSELLKKSYESSSLTQLTTQYRQICQNSDSISDKLTCNTLQSLIDTKSETELKKLTLAELTNEYSRSCSDDKISYSLCSKIEEISQEKSSELIQQYMADTNLLRKEYNQCFFKIQALTAEAENLGYYDGGYEKTKEAERVARSYPCTQAQAARKGLGFGGGFNEPIP